MWFSVFLLAFLFASAYFLAIQGFTNSAIMCVLTIVCLALSFGTYEYVAQTLLIKIKPDFAYALALMATFIVPLAVFRVLLDMWIPRCSLFPQIIDRGLGAAAGFVSAFLMTGVLALAIQMVPWETGFLGFNRFDPEKPDEPTEVWLKPDRATAAFAASLSDGIFSGSQPFAKDHPDFITELAWLHPGPERRGVRFVVPRDSVSIKEASPLQIVYEKKGARTTGRGRSRTETSAEYTARDSKSGQVLTKVTLNLASEAQDDDSRHRFTPRSIRLVGELDGQPETYHAIAIADDDEPYRYVCAFQGEDDKAMKDVADMLFSTRSGGSVEVVFEYPERFQPRFLAYKLGGRAPWKKPTRGTPQPTEQTPSEPTPQPTPPPTDSSSNDRVSGVRVDFGRPHFGSRLPDSLAMTSYAGRDTEIRSGSLVQGHVHGYLEDQESGNKDPVSSLTVPQDKCLLHLVVKSLRARSTLGKALNFTVQTLQNYTLEDDQGNIHTPVGKYAIARVGGRDYVEILYFPEYAESGGRFGQFNKIKGQHFDDDSQLVFLYLLDKGVKAVKFSTGRKTVDLTGQNLVAR